MGKIGLGIVGLLALAMGLLLGSWFGEPASLASGIGVRPALADPGPGDEVAGPIVRSFGVGGVLTEDGQLWQFRPDQNEWLPIDEAFREEGRETHVVPLPVPASEIAAMESFGFLITQGGESWLYEFTTDAWRKLPTPGEKR